MFRWHGGLHFKVTFCPAGQKVLGAEQGANGPLIFHSGAVAENTDQWSLFHSAVVSVSAISSLSSALALMVFSSQSRRASMVAGDMGAS